MRSWSNSWLKPRSKKRRDENVSQGLDTKLANPISFSERIIFPGIAGSVFPILSRVINIGTICPPYVSHTPQ
jgi:hypothetical protein